MPRTNPALPSVPPRNTILHGDALAILRTWPDACVDHCIADPPFNMSKKKGLGWAFSSHVTMQEAWDRFTDDDFFRFNEEWLREVCRVVKPNGNILVFGTYHNIYQLGFILQSGLNRRILNSIIWYKPNAQPNITARMLTESTEQILWAVNGTPEGRDKARKWTFNYWKAKELGGDRQHRNVLNTSSSRLPAITIANPIVSARERSNGRHPSQKPVALMEKLLALFTRPGELVMDPFAGTGSLAQAAMRRGRDYVIIEKDAEYYSVARANVAGEQRNRQGAIHRWAELKSCPLTEREIAVLDGVPVPQADRLDLIIAVIDLVANGIASRTAIADQLHTDSRYGYAERQGSYYAGAAQALGWIEPSTSSESRFSVTIRGDEIARASGVRRERLVWEDIKKTHFGLVADELGIDLSMGIGDEERFAEELAKWFDLSKETAGRRTHTICNWIRQLREHELR